MHTFQFDDLCKYVSDEPELAKKKEWLEEAEVTSLGDQLKFINLGAAINEEKEKMVLKLQASIANLEEEIGKYRLHNAAT